MRALTPDWVQEFGARGVRDESEGSLSEGSLSETAVDVQTDAGNMHENEAAEFSEAAESSEAVRPEASEMTPQDTHLMVEFRVEVHGLAADERVYLVGSDTALGGWQPKEAAGMLRCDASAASSPCGQSVSCPRPADCECPKT